MSTTTKHKPHIVWLRDGGHMQPVRERMPFWADGYVWICRCEDSGVRVRTDCPFPRRYCPEVCMGEDVLGVLFFEGEKP